MNKIQEMNPIERDRIIIAVTTEGNELRRAYDSSMERAIRSILFINSGGVVTLLAYKRIGTEIKNLLISGSLLFFLLGLMLIFILVIWDYFIVRERLRQFSDDANNFFENKIPLNQIDHFNRSKKRPQEKILLLVGCISAFLAILGTVLGLLNYFI